MENGRAVSARTWMTRMRLDIHDVWQVLERPDFFNIVWCDILPRTCNLSRSLADARVPRYIAKLLRSAISGGHVYPPRALCTTAPTHSYYSTIGTISRIKLQTALLPDRTISRRRRLRQPEFLSILSMHSLYMRIQRHQPYKNQNG
jgi:hypothetical protein